MIPYLPKPTEDGLRHWRNRHWLRSQVLSPSSISISTSRLSHTGNRYTCRVPNTNPVRPLRSTGITRFPRYYEPVRLPTQPTDGYVFPPIAEAITLAAPDLPGSSTDLSTRAVPYHPDEPGGINGSLTPPPAAGFAQSGRLADSQKCNEAESGSLALRLARSLGGASARRLPERAARVATC